MIDGRMEKQIIQKGITYISGTFTFLGKCAMRLINPFCLVLSPMGTAFRKSSNNSQNFRFMSILGGQSYNQQLDTSKFRKLCL